MLCLYFSSEGNRGKVFFYLKWNGLVHYKPQQNFSGVLVYYVVCFKSLRVIWLKFNLEQLERFATRAQCVFQRKLSLTYETPRLQ